MAQRCTRSAAPATAAELGEAISQRLQPHGRVLVTDAAGFLVPDVDPALLTGVWRDLTDQAVAAYRVHEGARLHSVYVRGSAPRGLAVPGLSDLDTWALIEGELEGPLVQVPSWAAPVTAELLAGQGECVDLELCTSSLGRVLAGPRSAHARKLLQLSAICVWGRDMRPGLDPSRPDATARASVWLLPDALATTAEELATGADLDGLALWFAKSVLRAAFELVMPLERTWTRDLYWCWEAWSRHHPDTADSLARVARAGLARDDSPAAIAVLLAEPVVAQVVAACAALGPAPWATED